jgi:hypothetical protein
MKRHVTALACVLVCAPVLLPAQIGISRAFATSVGNGNNNGNGNTGVGSGNDNGNGNTGNRNGNGPSVASSDPGQASTVSEKTTTGALGQRSLPTHSYAFCAKGHRTHGSLGNGCF